MATSRVSRDLKESLDIVESQMRLFEQGEGEAEPSGVETVEPTEECELNCPSCNACLTMDELDVQKGSDGMEYSKCPRCDQYFSMEEEPEGAPDGGESEGESEEEEPEEEEKNESIGRSKVEAAIKTAELLESVMTPAIDEGCKTVKKRVRQKNRMESVENAHGSGDLLQEEDELFELIENMSGEELEQFVESLSDDEVEALEEARKRRIRHLKVTWAPTPLRRLLYKRRYRTSPLLRMSMKKAGRFSKKRGARRLALKSFRKGMRMHLYKR